MRIDVKHWIYNKPIAHRGLWNDEIKENSISAYQNAVNNGYAIEIDLYSSTDGELFCFHDQTLDRMTGEKGNIFDKTAEELNTLRLLDSQEKIPTFDELLQIVNGKVPILIELKNQPNNDYIDNVVKKLLEYKGEFAIQSFDPTYIKRVKDLAPQFIRGILGTKTYSKPLPFIKRLVVKNMLLNFLIKPDFISYSFEDLPLKKRKTKNKCLITWTVTTEEDYLKVKGMVDNVIFEKFVPQK